MRSYNPILSLGPKGCDVEKIITETNTGRNFEYDNYDNIKSYVLHVYKSFKGNKAHFKHGNITNYSVENQVQKLAKFLDKITD